MAQASQRGGGHAQKRTHSAPPLALALDGSLLLNASSQLDPALFAKLAQALSVAPSELFIGTRLPPAQRSAALNRFDNAVAEAAARIHGLGAQSSQPGQITKDLQKGLRYDHECPYDTPITHGENLDRHRCCIQVLAEDWS